MTSTTITTNNFKLRIYQLSGPNKGNLDHEELFPSYEAMVDRYEKLFVFENLSYNPTAWEHKDGHWVRISGF